jgi:hypothetical protein
MITSLNCQDTLDYLIKNGATVIEDKSEGKHDFIGRKILLTKNDCQFKISYLNFGGKEIMVEKACCCNGNTTWNMIPNKCFE